EAGGAADVGTGRLENAFPAEDAPPADPCDSTAIGMSRTLGAVRGADAGSEGGCEVDSAASDAGDAPKGASPGAPGVAEPGASPPRGGFAALHRVISGSACATGPVRPRASASSGMAWISGG